MRISLSDSLMSGFKKWSDAQAAKPQPSGVGPVIDGSKRRLAAATAALDERADDIG